MAEIEPKWPKNQINVQLINAHTTFEVDWIISAQDSGQILPYSVNFSPPEDRNLIKLK